VVCEDLRVGFGNYLGIDLAVWRGDAAVGGEGVSEGELVAAAPEGRHILVELVEVFVVGAHDLGAPTPGKDVPWKREPRGLGLGRAAPGSSTEYIHAKLCFASGMDTLKYQPSKKRRLVPSKW
jgi:hypothetical protein